MATFDVGGTRNLLLSTDSYKLCHYRMYPPSTSQLYGYFESRGGKYPYIVFFGLQYVLKRWFIGEVISDKDIEEAKGIYQLNHGEDVLNVDGWRYIVKEHGGRLPLRIKAVPEGTVVPVKNVLFTVESTDPKCAWITSFFQSLLEQTWYPCTVATNGLYLRKMFEKYMSDTADNLDGIPMKLSDFGLRATSSTESSGIGGAAHFLNFIASDTVNGSLTARHYYNWQGMGKSFPATEHSVITTWGREKEAAALRYIMKAFPDGALSIVCDSYDIFYAVDVIIGQELHDEVIKRGERGGMLGVRPDSGYPPDIVVEVLNLLENRFGTKVNKKGYKELPSYLRVIQADNMDYELIETLLETMKDKGWSAENILFGMGGSLLQKINRNTQMFAFKISHSVIEDREINVYKDPVHDKTKTSKKGRLTLELRDGKFITMQEGKGDPEKDNLVTVFENGRLLIDRSYEEVKNRVHVCSKMKSNDHVKWCSTLNSKFE